VGALPRATVARVRKVPGPAMNVMEESLVNVGSCLRAIRGRAASAAVPGAFAVAVLAVSSCHRAPPPATAPSLVVALPVHPDTVSGGAEAIRYPVEVAARYSNSMSFRVPGKLVERSVRLGDAVAKGQMIARLDSIDAQKQAASAEAALDAAEHRLLFAKQQLDRDKAQSAQNLIAANQFEQTQDAFSSALALRDEAAAQLVIARNTLRYNTLTADHDGVITSENADTGQVVSAGQPIYGLAWTGDTDVNLDAAESDLGRITIGQPASISFPALPGRHFDARVREVAPAADPQSRTYRVKLTLVEPGQSVRLGMTGMATLAPATRLASTDATASTFTVPATAIFHQGSAPAVWVIRASNSTLELRSVTVRSYNERSLAISAGLKDGDVVLQAGVHTVYAGEHVKVVEPLFYGTTERPAAGNTRGTPRGAAAAQ
jgi:multidrug efflux system membrane fusion protein